MNFAPGAIQLDDIIGGTLQAGEIPNARLETYLTALADALTAGGIIPHGHLGGYLGILAAALTAGGVVPHANLTGELVTLANALTAGGKVPHANLTGELVTLANALTAGGKVPHDNLSDYLRSLANDLTSGGKIPYPHLYVNLATLGAALTAGGKIPHSHLTGELATLANVLRGGGIVPHEKMWVGEIFSANASGVTLTASWTTLNVQNIGTISLNERVMVAAQMKGDKTGGIAGDVQMQVKQTAGTATVYFTGPTEDRLLQGETLVPSGESIRLALFGVGRVETAGTCIFSQQGMSEYSDALIPAGEGTLWFTRLLAGA